MLVISAFLVVEGNSLRAQEQENIHPYLTSKFFIDAGIFFPDRKVKFGVDGTIAGINQDIDFQEEFRLKRSDTIFSLNFGWRFGEKWQLDGQYFETSGGRSAILDEDVEWNDVVFGQGTGIAAGQDFALIRVFFARRFESKNEQQEFGIGGGLHWMELGAFIEGNIIISGGGTAFRRESVRAQAPLPNIGAWYTYSISPRWAFKGRLDWFGASIDDYSGTLTNLALGVNYQMFENFGIGLSYNDLNLDVSIKKSDWRGNAELSYKGLFAAATFYW